jgi:hypothetical protein
LVWPLFSQGSFTVFALEDSDNGGGAFNAKIRVVEEIASMKGPIIRVAFDHEFDAGLSFLGLSHFAEHFLRYLRIQ